MKINSYISLVASLLISWSTYAQQDPAINTITITPSSVNINQQATITASVGNAGNSAISATNDLEKMSFTISLNSSITGISINTQSSALSYFDITYDPINHVVVGTQKSNVEIAGNTFYDVIINGTAVSTNIHAVANITPNVMAVINEQATSNDSKANESALPVQLVAFTVQRENSTAALRWQTTEEINSDRFEILHSINGQNWSTLATLNAQRNSTSLQTYSYVDQYPESGVNYYRLKMIDQDGSYTMSPLQSALFDESIRIVLSPNPVSDLLAIKGISAEKIAKVEVHTTSGQLVVQTNELVPLDVRVLPIGMYIVTINRKDGSKTSHKIIKQ